MNIWDLCLAVAGKIYDALDGVIVSADLRPTYDAQAIGSSTVIIVTPGDGEINVVSRGCIQYADTVHIVFLAKVRRADGGLDSDKVSSLLSLVDSMAQILCHASFGDYAFAGEILRGDDRVYYPDDIDERIFAATLRVKFQRTASV